MTTIVKIIGSGTQMPVEDELVNKEDNYTTLRRALSAVTQGMPKAKITEKTQGDDRIIEVTPKLDGKGIDPDQYLQECQGRRNPAIDMYLTHNTKTITLGSHELYNLGLQATAAVKEGQQWIEQIREAEHVLLECQPATSSMILPG